MNIKYPIEVLNLNVIAIDYKKFKFLLFMTIIIFKEVFLNIECPFKLIVLNNL